MRNFRLLVLAVASVVLAACGGGGGGGTTPTPPPPPPPPPPVTTVDLSGVVEKGPFASGTNVAIYALSASGQRGQTLADLATSDELGSFGIEVDPNQTVEIEAIGSFVSELDGTTTTATLSLGAILRVGAPGDQASNVNVLSHLAVPRHRALLADSAVSEDAAASRARTDVLTALDAILPPPAMASLHDASLFSTSAADEASAYLVTLSAILSQRASELAVSRSTDLVSELQVLLDTLADDLGDGTLDNALLVAGIREASYRLDTGAVMANLDDHASSAGISDVPGDILMFVDSDLDGIANNADPDDDNDGVDDSADAYPLDWACYQSAQGNGSVCEVAADVPATYLATRVVEDNDGVLYLLDSAGGRIVRWSVARQAYGWTLSVPTGATAMTYSATHDRLYLGMPTGDVIAIETGGQHQQSTLATLPAGVRALAPAGDHLLAVDDGNTGYTYSIGGGLVDQGSIWGLIPGTLEWDDVNDRALWLNSGSPRDIQFGEIDGLNGTFGAFGSSPYHGDFAMSAPLRSSPDHGQVATGAGDVFAGDTLNWQRSMAGYFSDLAWFAGDSLVSIRDDSVGTRIEHFDNRGGLVEYGVYTGTPLRVFTHGHRVQVITQDTRPQMHAFVIGGDFDGDEIANQADAFPLDPAASADSDNDGYPDEWNTGSSESDSTTGLVLDAYPDEAICYLPGHGDGTTCDVAGNIPNYAPDWVVADSRGTVYLLSRDDQRIYRWDPVLGHLDPLPTDPLATSTFLRYSPDQDRIYLAYSSGRITYWDAASPSGEQHFSVTPTGAGGMQPAGNFVWAAGSGAQTTGRYGLTFSSDGALASHSDFRSEYSRHTAWNAANNRVYLFRDGLSPNDINYQSVDPVTGALGSTVDSPYHGDFSIVGPIRISLDGTLVLLGSGDIYDADTLQRVGSIASGFTDGLWIDQNATVVIQSSTSDTRLLRRDQNGAVVEVADFTGAPIAILRNGADFTVVTSAATPSFYSYTPSDDSDGDGVDNSADAFPLDPAASLDTDGDGYPDAWNDGMTEADSTTGLALDAYPNDAACYLPGHGDGTTCDITSTMPDYVPVSMALDSNDVLYLFSPDNRRIYRRDTVSGDHLNPFIVGRDAWLDAAAPSLMTYHEAHNRLYLAYDNGDINYIDLSAGPDEVWFATAPGNIGGVADVGNFLLVQDDTGAWYSHHIFDSAGGLRTSVEWNRYSRAYAWNETLNRVYFFRDATSPNDLHYEDIDQATGLITADGETPYHGGYAMLPPIRVSQDDTKVLLGGGDIFDATDLTWLGAIAGGFVDAQWADDGGIVTVSDNGGSVIVRRDENGNVVDGISFAGPPLALFKSGSRYLTVIDQGIPEIVEYVPSDDSDGDGVLNSVDAFPTDPAAAVDTDGDGYPDAWNAGMTEADSTTGLQLDAYPDDTACYLPEHGDGTTCDITSTMPDYVPVSVAADAAGIVYLFSPENNRVFRWDSVSQQHLNPFVIGVTDWLGSKAPSLMGYHAGHNRLYFGYDTGVINYIDLAGATDEVYFATMAGPVGGLGDAGAFLLAQDPTGAWVSHHTYDAAGTLIASEEWNYTAAMYAWNPTLDRVYFLRSNSELRFEEIVQGSGQFGAEGGVPDYTIYSYANPIRVSPDGTRVIVASGNIFDASDMNWITRLPGGFADVQWVDATSLITVSADGPDSRIDRVSDTGVSLERVDYAGAPIAILPAAGAFVVVTDLGRPEFYVHVPSDDSDGDGVANTLDGFPNDVAASADSDGDGYPDAWNAGMTAADSTTGLVLDAYANDSACFLIGHGDGVNCDPSSTVPNYIPDRITYDANGVVYLLSVGERRIYRWDPSVGHLNPLLTDVAPNDGIVQITISPVANRLYASYQSGRISYWDLGNPVEEQYFATIPTTPRGLQAAGQYLWTGAGNAQTSGEYNVTFDHNGNMADFYTLPTDYSRYTAWNETLDRVYMLRDWSSPNDIQYVPVDQTNGALSGAIDSPYHGDFSISPPIRISPNDQKVLLGSGDIYLASDLTWLASMAGGFVDGQWIDNDSTVVIYNDNGATLAVRRDASGATAELAGFAGIPLAITPSPGGFTVVTDQGQPVFNAYVPSDDSDGDGVANTVDAFPQDPAASVDSDGDGYPDAWNPGMTAADSTTGLVLDAYPNDSACFLPGHGDGTTCDIGSTIPVYSPSHTAIDGSGIVYLLSPAHRRVYRWDSVTEEHLNPLIVGSDDWLGETTPRVMAYHAAHFRLYLGYVSGEIRYIDLGAPAGEQYLANLPESVDGLADVGEFLLGQDNSGAWESHHILDATGTFRDSVEWNQYSRVYDWNPTLNRVYFFRDTQSPNDLLYEDVDQVTGEITAAGDSPYHGDYAIRPPIRVSDDGARVVLGSGDVYDASDLTWIANYPNQFTDGEWLADGRLATIRPNGANTTFEVLNTSYGVDSSSAFTNPPLAVLRNGGNIVVITSGSRPEFSVITP